MILTLSTELENIIQTLMRCQDVVASSPIRATAIRQGRVFQICHVEDVNIRGLLPDPNPRVPKYFRVSGRVSG